MKQTYEDFEYTSPKDITEEFINVLISDLKKNKQTGTSNKINYTIRAQFLPSIRKKVIEGKTLSSKQRESIGKISHARNYDMEIESGLDEGIYGEIKGWLYFGHDSDSFKRILQKGLYGKNRVKGTQEPELFKFSNTKFDGREIDPSLKQFFQEYAAKFPQTATYQYLKKERYSSDPETYVSFFQRQFTKACNRLEAICTRLRE